MKTKFYLVLVLVAVPIAACLQRNAPVLSSVSPTSVAAGGDSFPLTATRLAVSTSSVPSATVGSAYSATLTATGGTGSYTWSPYPSGKALPPGVQLTSIGALTGTPTTAGTYPFGVQVIDSANDEATQSYSMTVASSTVGCGAGTDNSQCGNVGDPYARLSGARSPRKCHDLCLRCA